MSQHLPLVNTSNTAPYWRLSSFYSGYFAALGALIPFWSLYLADRGFNALDIGELSALLVGTKVIAPNVWGWLADRTGKSLRIIRLALFFSAVFMLGFLPASSYLVFAFTTLLFSFFWNAALPQFEAVTLFHIRNAPLQYARIRVWGSIGFIVAVMGIGWGLDFLPIRILPIVISGLLAFTWCSALITPEAHTQRPANIEQSLWRCLINSEVLAFLLVYLLLQIAHSPYYVFFSIYLKQYQYSAMTTGCLWALGVCAEIVLFMFMRRVLLRFSLRAILLVSISLSALRWFLTARYADHFVIMLCAQLCHAATFGSLHVVAMQLIQQYFGKHHQGKGQGLYSSVSFGLGGMIGGYCSGYYWEHLGSEAVFLMASGCCMLALLIAFIWVGRPPVQTSA